MDIFGNFPKLLGDKKERLEAANEKLNFSYSEVTMPSIGKLEDKDPPPSILSLKFILGLIFIVLAGRLFYLQAVRGSDNQKLAEGNRIRPRVIEASRGLLTDRNGVWLARNKPDFALSIYPSDLPKKRDERLAVIHKIAEATNVPIEDITKNAVMSSKYFLDSVIIKDHISHDEALLLEEKIVGLPGIFIALRSSREYTTISGLGHILGYTGPVSQPELDKNNDYLFSDRTGKTGLEKGYESELKGVRGIEQVEVDSRGNIIRVLVKEENRDPVAGNDVSLYLDRDLQSKTAEFLNQGIAKARELTGNNDLFSGTAIIMDVNSGGILSMVSLPDYDNNLFSTKISAENYHELIQDKTQPLFDRSIGGVYPPGSISKIILAAAGLNEGTITPATSIITPPAITIGDYNFPDWKDHSYESTDVERAIAESNNVFFYSVGGGYDKIKGLGIDKINQYWRLFGLGEPTGIDLPGEESGLLPNLAWKKKAKAEDWYLGDTYHVSIGQGDLLVTPIQMVRATAVIANGGKLLHPRMAEKITSANGQVLKEFGPDVEREGFLGPEVVRSVAAGMRMAVTDGSARSLNDLPVTAAGKTGTAQFLNNQKTHAWFEAYAPYENPQIAVVVLIEGGGGGNEVAAPVVKEILNYYFSRH